MEIVKGPEGAIRSSWVSILFREMPGFAEGLVGDCFNPLIHKVFIEHFNENGLLVSTIKHFSFLQSFWRQKVVLQ